MKKWKIDLKAVDLDEAITYLKVVLSSFEAAKKLDLPMTFASADDPKDGSSINCKQV
jgi:hypothetical protein